MSLITIDPFSFIAAIRRDTKLFEYCVLVASMATSASGSFLFACGSALVAHSSWPISVGYGMIAASIGMAATWRHLAPKGSVVVLPGAEAAAEIHADQQVISK